jgi:hypothetical protein
MSTIKVVVSTKVSVFPAGTIEGAFEFALVDSTGATIQSVTSSSPASQFDGVAPGSYTVTVTKNGVTSSAAIDVPEADVSFNVPDTIVLTLS